MYSTDVNFRKVEEPWEYYRHRQFQFINANNVDYKQEGLEIPDYKNVK